MKTLVSRFVGVLLLLASTSSLAMAKESAGKPNAKEQVEEAPQKVGVELGEFFIRDVRASEGVKTRLSFTLFAEVDPEEVDALRAMLDRYERRIRDHVIIAVRLCQSTHFQEPSLARFKRRLLIRLRRGLPELKIESLMFRDFLYFPN